MATSVSGFAFQSGRAPEAQTSSAEAPSINPGILPPLKTGTGDSYRNRQVSTVRFEGLPKDSNAIQYLRGLAVQPGMPLDRRKLGDSVRALYATGRFAEIDVEAEPEGENEVTLVYVAKPSYFAGTVSVEGAPRHPNGAQLADATRLRLGEPYSQSKVDRALELMKELLAENGYMQPVIHVQTLPNDDTQQVNLRFDVEPGDPAQIGEVIVEGDAGYSAEQIRDITGLGEGHTVNAVRTAKALQRLRSKYSDQNRLEAQITLREKRFNAGTNRLDFIFRVVQGPAVRVEVTGADLNRRQLRHYIPVYTEHAVDDDLLNEGRRNLRNYFQSQGYFDVEVNFHREYEGNNLRVIYVVERGERHDLRAIEISGNRYFDEKLIRERMRVEPRGWLLSHGRFSQELLDEDVRNLTSLYRTNGFQQVVVKVQVKDDYQGETGRMVLLMDIVEGPQTLVSSLKIEGSSKISESEVTPLLTTSAGQPYSESNTAVDRDLLVNYYFDRGFSNVGFESLATPVPGNPERMQVLYRVTEGEQSFVDRILVSGLNYTKPAVAERQFRLHPGEALSQSDMLETQRHLYDLGVFNEVKMAVQNRDGESKYKNVLLDFTEARRWTFNYGLGVEIQSGAFGGRTDPEGTTGASPTVSFDVSRLNVGGRAHTLSFKSHLGNLQQRALLSYDAPRLRNTNYLRLTLNLLYDNSLNVRTFTSQRMETSAQLEQIVSRVTTLLYRFTYRRIKASDLQISLASLPLLSRPVRVGLPSFSYIREMRDDPIESHSGSYTTLDAGIASGWFGSEASFGRLLIQNSTYHAFRSKRWILARNTQIGIEEPFGSTVTQLGVGGPSSSTVLIPLPERFFAGGSNSLRGYSINQAGPRDPGTGQVLGGSAVFVNSLELRTPAPSLPYVDNNLSFVIFHDFGNVFASASEMGKNLLRWSQKDPQLCMAAATASQCNFSFMSHAAGAGIRYRTPIGPVRLDVGYNLNPPTYPFNETQPDGSTLFRSNTLGRWHFFFSIGQTF